MADELSHSVQKNMARAASADAGAVVAADAPVAQSGFDMNKLTTQLKAEMSPGIEAEIKKGVEITAAWLKEGLQNHSNTYLKFGVPLVDIAKDFAIAQVAKLDGK